MTGRDTAALIPQRFGAFLDAAPDAIIVIDANGRILATNVHALTMFGYTGDELVGQPVEILVPAGAKSRHIAHREGFSANPHARSLGTGLDLAGVRKDGTEFPADISLSPIDMGNGRLVIAAIRDITERTRLEEDIRRQSRMTSEFLANMSHELRTPLNSIIGFAQLLHEGRVGPVADDHREYLGDILASARHLLDLINDLLDLAKIESGRMDFVPEPVDVRAIVEHLRDLVRTQAATRKIRIDTEIDPSLGSVVVDPAKLTQVLYTYLSNALKFTGEGGWVVVRVRAEGAERFRLEVADDGIGIRPEDVGRLFSEFQQLDAGAAKRFQGTGLGLALTRRIVEAQGGAVGVASAPGAGSLFYAVLPRVVDVRTPEAR